LFVFTLEFLGEWRRRRKAKDERGKRGRGVACFLFLVISKALVLIHEQDEGCGTIRSLEPVRNEVCKCTRESSCSNKQDRYKDECPGG